MKTPVYSTRFKKEYKLSQKRGFDLGKIDSIISDLVNEIPLSPNNKDHDLIGDYVGCRECHILADWLLIYKIDNGDIVFLRTGRHTDLF